MKILIILFLLVLNTSLIFSQTYNTCATAYSYGNVTDVACTNTTFNIGGANVPDLTVPTPPLYLH